MNDKKNMEEIDDINVTLKYPLAYGKEVEEANALAKKLADEAAALAKKKADEAAALAKKLADEAAAAAAKKHAH